ncbi:MAG TPA: alginate export family protein [Polyangiaceae bacterium]
MRRRAAALVAIAGAIFARAELAAAQPASPPDGVAIGEFWFRPRLELRSRGEYYHHPVAASEADLAILGSQPLAATAMDHQWVVHERARFGLTVERGPLSGTIVVQDARLAGFPSPASTDRSGGAATTSFHAAFVEWRTPDTHPSFLRIGRQEIALGEGRLVGISDWELVPRSLDAARGHWTLRQFDLGAFAALLTPPGSLPPQYGEQAASAGAGSGGTGTQLYALAGAVHVDPLLHGEVLGLARVVRYPVPGSLTPSDTIVVDARLFGDQSGLTYAAEFAYELGRVAIFGGNRDLAAWGATAHIDWQTTWPLRPKWSLAGSYATGDDGQLSGTVRRFDPILPDARAGLGQMGLYAWSNIVDGAATVTSSPSDDVSVAIGYRYIRLADPKGPWFTASLAPVGQNIANEASFLGHELDASVSYAPLEGLGLRAGYGAFVTGAGARAILSGGPRLLSAAFLQVSLAAP